MTARIAVLASGGGTNLHALLEHLDRLGPDRAGDVVLVASDRRDAGVLERAAARAVPTALLESPAREGTARPLAALLDEHEIDVVALGGYLRLVPADVVDRYRGRIVNVHPALLPSFGGAGMYGRRVHRAVLDAGVTVSGATVHFVDHSYDRGPVIAQWPVPVIPGDSAATLAERVLRVEHLLYPAAIDAVAAGRITLATDGSVQRARLEHGAALGGSAPASAFCFADTADPRLATDIARAIGA